MIAAGLLSLFTSQTSRERPVATSHSDGDEKAALAATKAASTMARLAGLDILDC